MLPKAVALPKKFTGGFYQPNRLIIFTLFKLEEMVLEFYVRVDILFFFAFRVPRAVFDFCLCVVAGLIFLG